MTGRALCVRVLVDVRPGQKRPELRPPRRARWPTRYLRLHGNGSQRRAAGMGERLGSKFRSSLALAARLKIVSLNLERKLFLTSSNKIDSAQTRSYLKFNSICQH